jgi:hypothetical protein
VKELGDEEVSPFAKYGGRLAILCNRGVITAVKDNN